MPIAILGWGGGRQAREGVTNYVLRFNDTNPLAYVRGFDTGTQPKYQGVGFAL